MICETIDLYEYFGVPRGENGGGYLTAYARSRSPEIAEKLRPAMLVIPGGGYSIVSDRENEPIALRLLAEGYAAFSLVYTVHTPYPVPLLEGAMAMAYIRKEHEKYCVDPAKVAEMGFSAGGHLAGMLMTLYHDEHIQELLKEDAKLVRPDAAVLCYAVLSTGEITHGGTAQVISGGDPDLRAALSVPERVTKDCPPVFLWHTVNDGAVPVKNSVLMAEACAKAGVPFEMHLFEDGPHGLSLGDEETSGGEGDFMYRPDVQSWFPLMLSWLSSRRGFLVKKK